MFSLFWDLIHLYDRLYYKNDHIAKAIQLENFGTRYNYQLASKGRRTGDVAEFDFMRG